MNANEFVKMVAALKTDEEMAEMEGGEECDGWSNDDAWTTLHRLIEDARAVEPTPVREAGYGEDHGLDEKGMDAVREAARRLYSDDFGEDDIEVDIAAPIVLSGNDQEPSYWVQAWVYVREEDL